MTISKKRLNKQMLINSFGGKCQICGYDKCLSALDFHHRDPKQKEYNISKIAGKKVLEFYDLQELAKCILLCANCHREVHSGMHDDILQDIPSIEITDLLC